MIRVRFMRAFEESLDALHAKDSKKTRAAIDRLLTYFDGGTRPLGLGLRKLKGSYWEVRVGLDRRVLFTLESDLATFLLVGSHDEIRRRIHS